MIFDPRISLGAVIAITFLGSLLWTLFIRLEKRLCDMVEEADQAIHAAGTAVDELRLAITRVESVETRMNAVEHRLTVIERWQIRALDAEATARGAGIYVPPPMPQPED